MRTKSHTITNFYTGYVKSIGDNPKLYVDYNMFRKILNMYFLYLRDQVLYQSKTIKLPFRLGYLNVIKRKPKTYDSKSLRLDFAATNKYGKVIYHLNEHSDGFKYRFYWSKLNVIVPNHRKYQLIATRANKRELARIIKSKERDYIEI